MALVNTNLLILYSFNGCLNLSSVIEIPLKLSTLEYVLFIILLKIIF